MTNTELFKIHKELCSTALELMQRKNHDYAGSRGNEPFANFTRTEAMGITTTEKAMLVRMLDKMSRLSSFVESGKLAVENESFEDTIIDIVNYSVLMYAYLHDKKASTQSGPIFVSGVNPSDVVSTNGNGCCKSPIKKNEEPTRPLKTYYISSPWKDTTRNS